MNFIDGMRNINNVKRTENGMVSYKSTLDNLLDFFAVAGAIRERSEDDVNCLFSKAFAENKKNE